MLISSLAISKLSLEERPVHSLIYIIENFLSATTQTLCASTSHPRLRKVHCYLVQHVALRHSYWLESSILI